MPIKGKGETIEVTQVVVSLFDAGRRDAFDRTSGEKVGELGVQAGQFVVADKAVQAKDQLITDEAHGVIRPVETADFSYRFVYRRTNRYESHVVGGNQLFVEQFQGYELIPTLPVRTPRGIEQHDRGDGTLAGLDQG